MDERIYTSFEKSQKYKDSRKISESNKDPTSTKPDIIWMKFFNKGLREVCKQTHYADRKLYIQFTHPFR